jgi:hypothetical protein
VWGTIFHLLGKKYPPRFLRSGGAAPLASHEFGRIKARGAGEIKISKVSQFCVYTESPSAHTDTPATIFALAVDAQRALSAHTAHFWVTVWGLGLCTVR